MSPAHMNIRVLYRFVKKLHDGPMLGFWTCERHVKATFQNLYRRVFLQQTCHEIEQTRTAVTAKTFGNDNAFDA